MTVTTDVNGLLGLQVVIAVLLPAVVGLVTKKVTDPKIKVALLLALTGVTSVAQELAASLHDHTEFRLFDVLMVAVGSYVLSMAVHFGIMNPTGLKDKLQAVGSSGPALDYADHWDGEESGETVDPYADLPEAQTTSKHRADS